MPISSVLTEQWLPAPRPRSIVVTIYSSFKARLISDSFQACSIPNIRPNRFFWNSRPLPYFFWEGKLASCPTTQQKIEASIFHLFFCDACARILRLIWTSSEFRALVQLCGFLGLISCPVRNHQSNLLLQKNDTRTSFPPWHESKVLQVLRQINMRSGKRISKSVRYWCLANVTWPESVVEL